MMRHNVIVSLWLISILALMVTPGRAIELNNPYIGRITPEGPAIGQQNYLLGHPRPSYEPRNIENPKTFGQPNLGPTDQQRSWCRTRYRSYRQSDNSYLNHLGIRKPCLMP